MTASIEDLLQVLRDQQGAMLGRKSADSVSAFLSGYAAAKRETGDTGATDFLLDFNDWVHARFKVQSTQGWAKVIGFYCNQEAEELDLFWKLYDEYHSEQQNRQTSHRTRVKAHDRAVQVS